MKKRVLIFSFVYYPNFVGGAEVAIKEITDRISTEDFEFDLIALRFDKNLLGFEKIGNVNVYRVGFTGGKKTSSASLPFHLHLLKFLYPIFAVFQARRLHKKNTYDAMWAMMANYSGFGAILFKILNKKIPLILTLQEGDPIPFIKRKVRFVWPLFKLLFKRASIIQVISNYLAQFAKDMGATCPVVVVPNGVSVGAFMQNYSATELLALFATFNREPGDIFLITTSRLVVKNAVGDIIESLIHLPKEVKLLILGVGYQEVELKERVHQLGLEKRVYFVGYVPHEHMPRYLKISDIFIRPSLSEGFGNSFIEAMAVGVPVIATPVGGIVDFLRDRETGLFCEVSSPKDIAEKVMLYITDDHLRKAIIESALQMVVEKYDWNLVVESMKKDVFNRVVSLK